MTRTGTIIDGRYRVERLLGTGSIGRVYLAWDEFYGERVAVKVFAPREETISSTIFLDEFRTLADLNHPHFPRVYDFGYLRAEGRPYFTVEYIEGADLFAATRGRDPSRITPLVVQLCHALEYLHALGLLHGDLKPGNILVTRIGGGELVKVVDMSATGEGRATGTFPYLAPEVLKGGNNSVASDLYALGVTLYQVYTGVLPHPVGEDIAPLPIPGGPPLPARHQNPEIPEEIDRLLGRLLDPDPERRPQRITEVVHLLSPQRSRHRPVAGLGRLVGREGERLALAEIRGGGSSCPPPVLTLLVGETGIGKSRLLQAFKNEVQIEGALVFSVRCADAGPFSPFRSLLRQMLTMLEPAVRSALKALVAPLTTLDGSFRLFPEYAELSAGGEIVSEAQRFEQILRLFTRCMAELSPLVLFDDLHEADRESLECMDYLIRNFSIPSGMLLAATLPPRESGEAWIEAFLQRPGVRAIELGSLPETAQKALLDSILPGLPEEERTRIIRRSGGNPLFLQEDVYHLVERGILRYAPTQDGTEGGWVCDGAALEGEEGASIPARITKRLEERLLGLAPGEIEILWKLAATRRPLPLSFLIEREGEGGEDPIADVVSLREKGLIEEEERRYVLAFPRLRPLLYERIPPSRRPLLHQRILAFLLGEGEDDPERIAEQALLAQRHEAGIAWSITALERLLSGGAWARAAHFGRHIAEICDRSGCPLPGRLRHLWGEAHLKSGNPREALEILEGALETESDLSARCGIEISMGEALLRLGEHDRAAAILESAQANARKRDDQEALCRILWVLGRIRILQGDYAGAIRAGEEALHLAPPTGLLPRIEDVLGLSHFYLGHYDTAETYYRQGLRHARGDRHLHARMLNSLGMLLQRRGRYDAAVEAYRGSFAIAHELGDLHGAATYAMNLGTIAHERSAYGEAIRYYEQAFRLAERIADDQILLRVSSNLGNIHLTLGRLAQARRYLDRSLELCCRHRMELVTGYNHLLLGAVGIHAGQRGEAAAHLTRALALFGRLQSRHELCRTNLRLAESALAGDDLSEARFYLDIAGDLASELESLDLEIEWRVLLGEVFRRGGDLASAWQTLEPARRRSREIDRPELLWDLHLLLARLALQGGDDESALEHFHAVVELQRRVIEQIPQEFRRDFMKMKGYDQLLADMEELRRRMAGEGTPPPSVPPQEDAGDKRLRHLLEINKSLNSQHDLSHLLEFIMDTAIELTHAERGFLILLEGEEMKVRVARNIDRENIHKSKFKVSHSIAKEVVERGEAIIAIDARNDERFAGYLSVHDLKLRSILCVPLKVSGATIGTIYLDNRFQGGSFTPQDLELLHAFGDQAAIAIEKARLIEENIAKQRELERSYRRIEELNRSLEDRLERQSEQLEVVTELLQRNRADMETKYNYANIIGRSDAMQRVFQLLDRVVESEVPVLIQGESGTGKDLVARAIHFNGPRKAHPFVSENCAAIPETLLEAALFGHVKGAFTGAVREKRGLFELAHRGTIFLDEIGDMSLNMQAKLLRVIEEQAFRRVGGKDLIRVDVRLISATNRNLRRLIEEGRFREDLFYRLDVVTIELPPLRERREDIPLLIEHFLERKRQKMPGKKIEIDPAARRLLLAYDWPGNVRELEHEIERIVVLCDGRVTIEDISPAIRAGTRPVREEDPLAFPLHQPKPLKEIVERYEKRVIEQILEEVAGNKVRAAKLLGIGRRTLYEKLDRYGLK